MGEFKEGDNQTKAWEWREVDAPKGYRLALIRKRALEAKEGLTEEENKELEFVKSFLSPEDHKEEWEK